MPEVTENSKPQDIENDWLTNFFDKCRIVSNEQMQAVWAKVLAGEANSPGKFSKRTVNYLASLDMADAQLFTALCGFACFATEVIPMIYDVHDSVLAQHGITFTDLKHLDDIGLIRFETLSGFRLLEMPKTAHIYYHGTLINLEFPLETENYFELGKVLLTKAGQELAPLTDSKGDPDILDSLLNHWSRLGLVPSSPYPRVVV